MSATAIETWLGVKRRTLYMWFGEVYASPRAG